MDPNLQKLQEQSRQMQQALQQEQVISENYGVKIVMRGDQQVISVTVNGQEYPQFVEVFNDVIRKTQQLAAQKLIALQQG